MLADVTKGGAALKQIMLTVAVRCRRLKYADRNQRIEDRPDYLGNGLLNPPDPVRWESPASVCRPIFWEFTYEEPVKVHNCRTVAIDEYQATEGESAMASADSCPVIPHVAMQDAALFVKSRTPGRSPRIRT
jgi:hypothetical protein